MRLIAQGAEARVFCDGSVLVKERPVKGYRVSLLDAMLRKSRTRREAKVLVTLKDAGIPSPELLDVDDSLMKLSMSFLDGPRLRDVFREGYAREMGELIGRLHSINVIHGDLTTSNIIVLDKLHLIDFGLSFFSHKVEDKAVDLFVLLRALRSRHPAVFERASALVIEGYIDSYAGASSVLKRLNVVRTRGRHRRK